MSNSIVLLMPSLMLDNNRKVNNEALTYAQEHYDVDLIVINDQEYQEFDYRDGIHYIGHHKERQGFVKARNQLLEWFYNSDYDWVVWMDANSKVTKTTLNDFRTIVEAIKNNKVEVDVILSTLGIYISASRILARQTEDHLKNVKLTPVGQKESDLFHGLFMRNFKKYYGMEPYMDKDCDPRIGLSEDVYFVQLCKKLFEVRLCPTIIITKPSNKTSTWMHEEESYNYAPIDWKGIARMVKKNPLKPPRNRSLMPELPGNYKYPRSDYQLSKVTVYKTRKNIMKGGLIK